MTETLIEQLPCGECGESRPDVTRCLRCRAADALGESQKHVESLQNRWASRDLRIDQLEAALGVTNVHEYCPHCDHHFDSGHDRECPVYKVTETAGDTLPNNDLFTCPECGSHNFGTQNGDDWAIATGYCHGYREIQRCGFEWLRSNDNNHFGPRPLPVGDHGNG